MRARGCVARFRMLTFSDSKAAMPTDGSERAVPSNFDDAMHSLYGLKVGDDTDTQQCFQRVIQCRDALLSAACLGREHADLMVLVISCIIALGSTCALLVLV